MTRHQRQKQIREILEVARELEDHINNGYSVRSSVPLVLARIEGDGTHVYVPAPGKVTLKGNRR